MTRVASTDLAERVARPAATRATSGVAGMVEQMGPQFQRALPAHIPAERFTRLALTALRSNPALARCTPASFLGALMTCAQLGLEPNTPTGEAYLIPYGTVCTFVPGYQGLVKLAWQSGEVDEISAELVHERDTFSFTKGLHRDLVHEPVQTGDPGKVIGAYAVVKLRGGGVAFDYWPIEQIEEHAAAHSKKRTNGPADLAGWMQRKVVLKQVLKLVPKSTNLHTAMLQDGAVRTDLHFDAVELVDAEVIDDAATEDGAA